jgi:hypothetical protein
MANAIKDFKEELSEHHRKLEMTYNYSGAGPGLSGISFIKIEWRNTDTVIFFTADQTTGQISPDLELILERDATWQEIVKSIIENNIFAFITEGDMSGNFPWPDQINIKYATANTDFFILWCWAGPPLSEIVEALYFLDKNQSNHIGTILKSITFNRSRLKQLCGYFYELDNPKNDLKFLISRQKQKLFTMYDLVRDQFNLIRIKEAEYKAKCDFITWAIDPFKTEIETIVENWSKKNPATGVTHAMGQSARKAAIRNYLTQYIIQNGCLPQGKHSIEAKIFNSSLHVSFDVDELI